MNFNRLVARISETLGTVRSASHVAAAVEGGRRPDAHHLRRLGIEPRAFNGINRG